MNFSKVGDLFGEVEGSIGGAPWFNGDWLCCSGIWRTQRYGDTILLRLTKRNWSSVFPVTLYEGGEIQYAAWIDEKLLGRSTVQFEMHVFSLLARKKVKKRDFAEKFRARNQTKISAFGAHNTQRGPAVPYAGAYRYRDARDLNEFLIEDFSNFASLSGSIDEILAEFEAEVH